jgi:hypothetical protein
MNYYIAILPNTNDDWTTISPFTQLLTSESGYAIGSTTDSNLTTLKLLTNTLLDISEIDKSINIFSDKGIGGIASSGDFSFTVDKINVTFTRLIGRSIEVRLSISETSLSESADVIFTGRIYKVKPDNDSVKIVCRGLIQALKEKEIGTVSNSSSEVYKSEITPIVYGDQTDDNAFSPLVLDKNLQDIPNLVADNQPLSSVDSVVVYDDGLKKVFEFSQNVNLNSDKNKITLFNDSTIVLKDAIDNSQGYFDVVDPTTVAFEFSSSTVGLTVGDIYQSEDGVIDYQYEFIEEKDGYYIFSVMNLTVNLAGTLTKVSGSGPSTIDYSYRSEKIDPILFLEQSSETGDTIDSAKPKTLVIKIDDEYLLVYKSYATLYDGGGNIRYTYTRLYVQRAYYDTIAVSHVDDSKVYFSGGVKDVYSWKTQIKLWTSDLAGFKSESSGTKIDFVSGDLEDLISMFRLGVLGDKCVFGATKSDGLEASYFIDLVFPKLNIKGEVTDAFLLGYYKASHSTYSMGQSAVSVIVGGLSNADTYLFKTYSWPSLIVVPWGTGSSGRLVKLPISSNYKYCFPYYNYEGINRTYSLLSFKLVPALTPVIVNFEELFCTHAISGQVKINDEDSYSLKNKVEIVSGQFIKDAPLGNIDSFNELRIAIKFFFGGSETLISTNPVFEIANPGLLLNISINPLEQEVFLKVIGRGAYTDSVSVITDILDKELSFTNITDNVGAGRDTWKLAFTLSKITKAGDLLQSIAEQMGIIISEGPDGSLSLNSLTPPDTVVTIPRSYILSTVFEENNIPVWLDEYTDIDKLITDITVNYQYNLPGDFFGCVKESTDFTGISSALTEAKNIVDVDQKLTLEIPFIRDDTTVQNLVELMINYYYHQPMQIVTTKVGIENFSFYIGQWFAIEGETGKFLVIGQSINLVDYSVTLKLLKIG